MLRFSVTMLLILIMAITMLLACSDDENEEYRSDNTEIARLLTDDKDGKAIFPKIWIDTTDHLSDYVAESAALDYVNPLDYNVEIVNHRRGFVIRDSCAVDTIGGDPCGDIPLETGGVAPAKVVQIHDTIDCTYHIIQRSDSTIAVSKENVRLIGISWVLMAQMGISEAHYNGWNIYAVGRQRQADNYVGALPRVDSIRIRPRSGDFTYYPAGKVNYLPTVNLPEVNRGESFSVYVYTSPRLDEYFYEAYAHSWRGGVVKHERIGISSTGQFSFSFDEASEVESGGYSQIVVELFPFTTLRDDSPTAFGTSLFGITYKVK